MQTIVFFDGYCGLCNGVVDFLVARDHRHVLLYTPLQGETAREILTTSEREDLNTVIVVKRSFADGSIEKYEKSEAILQALGVLGPCLKFVSKLARIFPLGIRDIAYDFIANNRFKFFGRRESCRVPTAEEKKMFLP